MFMAWVGVDNVDSQGGLSAKTTVHTCTVSVMSGKPDDKKIPT